ncbi:MAG: hypothetical protein KDD44_00240 [Bdellovibrionales bacterium]|nr:hypothetical protein [Bdellovibrionales bacterium]
MSQLPKQKNTDRTPLREMTSRALARAIFRGDLTAEEIREVPPQSLYVALQRHGLESIAEVLPFVSAQQYRSLLDFELWNGDRADEERFWSWLELIDDTQSHAPLEQLLAYLDPSFLGMMVIRYVDVIYYEEPTDNPPAPRYHTPDKGMTWLTFRIRDGARYLRFGKLLALIFERNPKLFYNLLALLQSATASELEEEAYRSKSRRLLDLAIPDHERAWEIHNPLPPERALDRAEAAMHEPSFDPNFPVIPLIREGGALQPLAGVLDARRGSPEGSDTVELELSRILNAAIVFFRVPFYEFEAVSLMTERIRGAINIGIERLQELAPERATRVVDSLSLIDLYQIGLYELRHLRSKAEIVSADRLAKLDQTDPGLSAIVRGAREPIALVPRFFAEHSDEVDATQHVEELSTDLVAVQHLELLRAIDKVLQANFAL